MHVQAGILLQQEVPGPFGLANIGVHFEFLVLGAVKVNCSELPEEGLEEAQAEVRH